MRCLACAIVFTAVTAGCAARHGRRGSPAPLPEPSPADTEASEDDGPEIVSHVLDHGATLINGVALLSGDAAQMLTVATDCSVRVWDTQTGALLRTFTLGADEEIATDCTTLHAVAASRDFDRIAISAWGRRGLSLWTSSGASITQIDPGTKYVLAIRFSEDGRWLATASASQVRIWDVPGGLRTTLQVPGTLHDIALSSDGTQIVAAMDGGNIVRWPISGGEPHHLRSGPGRPFLGGVYLPAERSSRVIVTTSGGPGEEGIDVFEGAAAPVRLETTPRSQASVSPDGRWVLLAAGFPEAHLELWDLEAGALAGRLSDLYASCGTPLDLGLRAWGVHLRPDGSALVLVPRGTQADVRGIVVCSIPAELLTMP